MAYRRTMWRENETTLSAEHMNNIETGIEEALSKAKGNQDMWEYVRNLVYPVGSIYMSVNNINPSSIFGGTWVAWGKGKVPVGVNTSDTDFSTVEKTGGAKSVTLTGAQSGLKKHSHSFTQPTVPKHGHSFTQPTISNKSLTGRIILRRVGTDSVAGTSSGVFSYQPKGYSSEMSNLGFVSTMQKSDAINFDGSHNHTASGGAVADKAAFATTGGAVAEHAAENATSAHTNLQPYITCYMWKRTA